MEHLIFDEKRKIVDVTIILNIWKRDYFEEQITSLLTQTVLPKEIWVLHYESHVEIQSSFTRIKKFFPEMYLFNLDKNLVFFGRHSIAINVNTKFIWIIDDDIIPGKKWLERCTKKCGALNSIITCTGRIMTKDDYKPEEPTFEKLTNNFIGDSSGMNKNICFSETIVDYGCNSYFFKKEWVSAFWAIWPVTFLTGDDIHLSASCKTQLNIDTVVLRQTNELNSGNIRKSYGFDEIASWKALDFISQRETVFKHHILQNDWTPILWKSKAQEV